MNRFDPQLHCDEFYCGICKQIYPSHLGIPWYGRLDCPWCHDCTKNGVSCTICANVPAWPNTSMAVKRVCKVKLISIEAAIGESVSYSQVGTIYENTTKCLEPYKKKSVGTRLYKVANAADAIVHDAVNAILDASLQSISACSLSEAVRLAKIMYPSNEEEEEDDPAQTPFAATDTTTATATDTATAAVPPPLDMCAPELDCLSHKQNAPLAHTSLTQDASWYINKID